MLSSSKNEIRKKFIERVDIFGTPISIRFNNFQKHTTIYGSLVTLLIFILLFLYSYWVLYQCFSYQRPNVVFQEKIVESPTLYNLELQKFSMAMGIQDKSLVHFIDEQIYYLDVQLIETKKVLNPITQQFDQTNKSTQIKMVPCSINHFQVEETQKYFSTLKYNNLYCFPLDAQLNLEGQFGALTYRRLYIQVKTCLTNCKDSTIIQQRLSNIAFQLYYVNYAVKSTDKDSPFKPIAQNTFWQSGISLFKNINVYFRKTTITSDFGLFKEEFTSDERLVYSFDRETIITKTDNKLYEIYIGLEKNKESEYIRTYLKLYSGISQIGGIYNILFFFGCIICMPISRLALLKELMNSIFDFQQKRDKQGNIDPIKDDKPNKQQSLQDTPLINTVRHIDREGEEPFSQYPTMKKKKNIPYVNQQEVKRKSQLEFKENLKQSENNVIQRTQQDIFLTQISPSIQATHSIFQQTLTHNGQMRDNQQLVSIFKNIAGAAYNRIKITFFRMIQTTFQNIMRRQKPYTKMINYGIDKLQDKLDIFYIMSKLIEIEKLKHLLLNENQIKLFEFIPKPTIYLSDFEDEILEKKILQASKRQQDKELEQKNSSPSQKTQRQASRFQLLLEDNRDEQQKGKEAEEAFFKIFQVEKSQSKIDRRLIQLLDIDLVQQLEQTSLIKLNTPPMVQNHQSLLNDTFMLTDKQKQKMQGEKENSSPSNFKIYSQMKDFNKIKLTQ